jgi:transcriptional regulator with XRE-family HTH domain
MNAATLLRTTRARHGIDQRALARRASTSQAQISRIERGEISPSVETLRRLLRAMGERLELESSPGPRGNVSTAELRADFERLSPGERVAQASQLSHAATAIAGGKPAR